MVTLTLGLLLCHGLGPPFGRGKAESMLSRAAVLVCLTLLIVVVSLEIVLRGE